MKPRGTPPGLTAWPCPALSTSMYSFMRFYDQILRRRQSSELSVMWARVSRPILSLLTWLVSGIWMPSHPGVLSSLPRMGCTPSKLRPVAQLFPWLLTLTRLFANVDSCILQVSTFLSLPQGNSPQCPRLGLAPLLETLHHGTYHKCNLLLIWLVISSRYNFLH